MVMVPERYKQFYAALKSLVETGEVPMSRIDDAVKRILRVKFAMGLMDPCAVPLADRSAPEELRLGCAPRGRAPGGPRVSGPLEERQEDAAAREDAPSGSTSPGRAPTTSATSAAAGRSPGRGSTAPDHQARRSSRPSRRRSEGGTTSPLEGRHRARPAPTSAVVVVGETPYAECSAISTDLASPRTISRRSPRSRRRGSPCRRRCCRAGR